MKYIIHIALIGTLLLTQCASPESNKSSHNTRGRLYYEEFGGAEEDARIRRDLGLDYSDYQSKHAKSYRAGFSAGRWDRLDGKALNVKEAFAGWGRLESYFREGYLDGRLNNKMRH